MAGYDYGIPSESHIDQCKRLGILKSYKCPICNTYRNKENGYKCLCSQTDEKKAGEW